MENAVPLEQVAADIDALVANDAAKRFEQLIPGQFIRRDRGGLTPKPAVEAAARRDKGALIGRERIEEGGYVGFPPVGVAELPHRYGVATQLAHNLVGARRHDVGIGESLFVMIFKRAEIPFPVQPEVQTNIEYLRRIER